MSDHVVNDYINWLFQHAAICGLYNV